MMIDWNDYEKISKSDIKAGKEFSKKSVLKNLDKFTHYFPAASSKKNFYGTMENIDWTNGFWTGILWICYEYAMLQGKKEEAETLRKSAEIQIQSFLNRIENRISVDHHDMGFLYSPSCVAAYKLIGSKDGKKAAVMAADQLVKRFQPIGEFIQAWGTMNERENYRLIIDCLLNVPLLYWASEETGDESYRSIADKHIFTTVANVIREDNSTWHTFYFDVNTGAPDRGVTCQGYRDGSAWARGQAWGVYGMACAYRYTGREEYIEKFENVTGYFLEHLPKDLVPYWDLEFSDGSNEPKDSSAASIAVCGMLEMCKYLDEEKAQYYQDIASKILKSVYDNYAVKDINTSNGLVFHGTYSKQSPYNTCHNFGVDECNIWGDYFYLEALTRISGGWNQYW